MTAPKITVGGYWEICVKWYVAHSRQAQCGKMYCGLKESVNISCPAQNHVPFCIPCYLVTCWLTRLLDDFVNSFHCKEWGDHVQWCASGPLLIQGRVTCRYLPPSTTLLDPTDPLCRSQICLEAAARSGRIHAVDTACSFNGRIPQDFIPLHLEWHKVM